MSETNENQDPVAVGSELIERLGAAADKLEATWKAFDDAVAWAQDCQGYALPGWDWKYGEGWREDEAKAIQAKTDLKDFIYELRHGRT